MRHFVLTVSTLFFLACATSQSASRGTDPAPPPPGSTMQTDSSEGTIAASITMQDGTSFERAVVIEAANEMEGVPKEYRWVGEHFPGYRMKKQSLTRHEGKPYDILHIIDASGAEHLIYFEISSYFGKM